MYTLTKLNVHLSAFTHWPRLYKPLRCKLYLMRYCRLVKIIHTKKNEYNFMLRMKMNDSQHCWKEHTINTETLFQLIANVFKRWGTFTMETSIAYCVQTGVYTVKSVYIVHFICAVCCYSYLVYQLNCVSSHQCPEWVSATIRVQYRTLS